MVFLPIPTISDSLTTAGDRESHRRAAIFHASPLEAMEAVVMGHKAVWRVWYGRRLGIPQSFEDIGSFDGAVNFAAFIEADRIEVVREIAAAPLSAEASA